MNSTGRSARRGLTFAAAALAATLTAAGAWATPVAGVVISLEGRPQVKPEGATSYKRLKVNDMVHEGDVVKTGKHERVGIAFVGGAELRINESSSFQMESGGSGDRPTSVFTEAGEAWTRLLHGHFSGMQVRTTVAVAAVRGTEADVDYYGGPMSVKVYDGHVDVMNDKGTSSVKAGQATQVAGVGQAPQPPHAMSTQEYASWQNGLKPAGLDKSLRLLQQAADENRTLKVKGKDGKEININLKKKQ